VKRFLSIFASCVVLLPAVAHAGPDSDAIVGFGLIGTWALNCQASPGPTNPFTSFNPSDTNEPTRQIVTGRPQYDGSVPLTRVTEIGATRLQFDYPQGGVTITVVLEKEDKDSQHRIRPINATASDGTVSVKDGIVQYNSQPTAWLYKCNN
jgi:hypothetical protein